MKDFSSDMKSFFYPAVMASVIFHGVLFAVMNQMPDGVRTAVRSGPNTLEVTVINRPVVSVMERDVVTKEIIEESDDPPNILSRKPDQPPKLENTSEVASQLSLGAVSDARPAMQVNAAPSYPGLARRKGWEGTVRLNVLVEKDGKAHQVAVEKSSGYSVLDRAALQAVEQWRFIPAYSGSQALRSKISIPIQFTLVRD